MCYNSTYDSITIQLNDIVSNMYTNLLQCHLQFHYDSVCGFSWAVAILSVLFLHLCGANLVMFLIREGFVGGFGGGKNLLF